jgi:hypothetical protein
LKKSFAPDDAYKLLEYIESRVPDEVATQKDIYALKLDIEKGRADLLKWSFTFWIAQMALLAGILFKLLS